MTSKRKKVRPLRQLVNPLTIYELFIFILSLYAVIAVIATFLFPLDGETRDIFRRLDSLFCVIFFVDFLARLIKAPNHLAYLKWGCFDLISSIPAFGIPILYLARLGRLYRIVQVIRTFRGVQTVKQITEDASENRAQSTFLFVTLLILATIVVGSVVILHYEREAPDSQIQTAHDAVWWSVVTITTVGYGDMVPVTREGRMVAMLMMPAGVIMFGAYTGFLTAWFISGDKKKLNAHIAKLERENARLKKRFEK